VSAAVVVPFPLARRLCFIDRQIKRASELNCEAAERHIAYQIEIQRNAMRRRNIDEKLIRHELASMESTSLPLPVKYAPCRGIRRHQGKSSKPGHFLIEQPSHGAHRSTDFAVKNSRRRAG
jgi:hypothetical protein